MGTGSCSPLMVPVSCVDLDGLMNDGKKNNNSNNNDLFQCTITLLLYE
jgi:hypothetical protein